jgi:xanthine dehydrogenase accessory factor
MTGWPAELGAILSEGQRAVRILLAKAEGSTPREPGAAMIVTAAATQGTIGGGRLEHEAIAAARRLLSTSQPAWHREMRHVALGPALGQCCGGRTAILLEHFGAAEAATFAALAELPLPFVVARQVGASLPLIGIIDRKAGPDVPLPVLRAARDMLSGTKPSAPAIVRLPGSLEPWLVEPAGRPRTRLYLYGAGHVGRAVVRALEPLPFDIVWADVDRRRFPDAVPGHVGIAADTALARIAAAAPPTAFHLVMTFSHPLDLDICHAILRRGDFQYLGLIGSDTKAMRFRRRLREAGISPSSVDRLVCPVGLPGVPGKEPAMIAAGIAADLLMRVAAASAGGSLCGRETLGR